MRKRPSQHGYTMVLFLAFITSSLLAAMALYDSNTVATERMRMQNTADATAYSTVNVMTRDMNFIAYTNRGMVANQVAIGQAVGLSSWIHMLDKSAENIDDVASLLQWVPYVGPVLKKITSVIQKATGMAKKGIDKGAKIVVTVAEASLTMLTRAQRAFQLAAAEMAIATYRGVSKANDDQIKTNLLIGGASYASLLGNMTRVY